MACPASKLPIFDLEILRGELQIQIVALYSQCFAKELDSILELGDNNPIFLGGFQELWRNVQRTEKSLETTLSMMTVPIRSMMYAAEKLREVALKPPRPFESCSNELMAIIMSSSPEEAALCILRDAACPFAGTKSTTNTLDTSVSSFSTTELATELASMAPSTTSTGPSTSSVNDIPAEINQRIQQLKRERKGEIGRESVDAAAEFKKHMHARGDLQACDCYLCTKEKAGRANVEVQKK